MKKSLNMYLKASIFYIFGNGIGQGLMLLSSIIFTRIMSQNDFGLYSTYYSVVTILNTLIGANLFNGLNNAYIDYKEDIHKYRSSNLFLSTLIFVTLSIIAIIVSRIINFGIPFFMILMALVHSYGFFVINYYNYSATMENKYISKTVFLMLPNILQIGFSILFIMCLPTSSVNARIIGSTLGVGLCAVAGYLYIMSKDHTLVNKEYWNFGLRISVPSVLSSISYMLMSQCDHIMITAFCGPDETAVYSLIYNIGYILYAVMQATTGVLSAWLYRAIDANETKNVKIVQKWYMFVMAIIAMGLLMVGPEIIKILAPKEYWVFDYIGLFVIGSYLMVMYTFYTTLGLFYKKSGMISIFVCISAICNIVTNYIFIPIFGGVAAACTSASAYFILFLLLRGVGQRLNKGIFSDKYFILFFAGIGMLCIIFEVIYSNMLLRYTVFGVFFIFAGIYVLLKKKEWMGMLIKK